MESDKKRPFPRTCAMVVMFLLIAPSLASASASADPSPAIRGLDNSDVLKELGVDIQNDGKCT